MRIAVLGSRGYPSTYGGFETFVRRIAPWLVAQGHEVTVYGRGGRRRSQRLIDGISVVDTRGLSGHSTSTATQGLSGAFDCWRTKPDAVLVLNVANGLGLPLLRWRKIPSVVNVDGIEWERDKWGRVARACFRIGARSVARYADVVVADSEEVARIWARDFGVTPTFVPYGADVGGEARAERVLAEGIEPGRYALVVARLVPENNVELFLDALERLDWTVPAVVVGSATRPDALEERLRTLDAEGRIRWLGHVADQDLLADLWANAGVYVHGHSVGGTNPALLQALGYGAPTIAVDTAFNREVLGDAGCLVPADAERLAKAIGALLGDPEARAAASARGRATVLERYPWEVVLSQYAALLRHVADGT
jgi:glycosyltransferase involved in cell wall biosynthesis